MSPTFTNLGHANENGLTFLNALSSHEAQNELLKCCGSTSWARNMDASRPFGSVAELIKASERIWWSLKPEDWLEAFRSHPKIGERKAAAEKTSTTSLAWSGKEQSGVSDAAPETKELLAELNQRYEEEFGFIYIVCATGKTSEELLKLLQCRLPNEAGVELRTAAGEQAKITELRLYKLIESLEQRDRET